MKQKVADALKNTSASYYIKSVYYAFLKVKNFFLHFFRREKIRKELTDLIKNSNFTAIDLFYFRFGWSAKSFQRAQHIALNLSKNGVLVFYAKNPVRDDTKDFFTKIEENIYLIDVDDPILMSVLKKELKKVDVPKILHSCSTNMFFTRRILNTYTKNGYQFLYEYIDEISPELSGNVPTSFISLHTAILKNKSFTVVSSAKELYKKVALVRGDENHILAQNAVEYDHWQVAADSYLKHPDIAEIKSRGNPVVGYFGALAKWFDYELLRFCAETLPRYEFVLIGWQYDDSFTKSRISSLPNIHFLGAKDYSMLPEYITAFDAAVIPFLINDITLSTSPVKLFEYLAAGKPSLCTPMPECVDTSCVLIGNNPKEFVSLLEHAISDDSLELSEQRKCEARNNTWNSRVLLILDTMNIQH